ncbi:MAG: thiamine pyrophosphate-binding protein [Chloroflexota bacterium]
MLVHVDAGTQNIGGALHNAQRSHAGMVICAGRAPYTWEGEMPGGKDLPIHFWQEQVDQPGVVRNYVKWHYELSRVEHMDRIMERAYQIAAAEPAGPVYLMLPREVLMLPAPAVRAADPRRTTQPTPAAADPAAVRAAAELLLTAERPLIVAGETGRHTDTFPHVAALAESIGARLIDNYDFASVPGSHPLNLGPQLETELPRADVVLFLDPNVPYVPNLVRPAPDARIIQIDRDPLHQDWVTWNFPVDLRITGSTVTAVPLLRDCIAALQTDVQRGDTARRRAEIRVEKESWRAAMDSAAQSRAADNPIHPQWLAWCLKETLPADAIILEDVITNRVWARTYLSREMPGTLFTPGGSSLGWANNAAIGVKLARPDAVVVSLMGDGGFTFSNPVAALWTAEHARAPSLTVIFNNGGYNASKRPIADMYPGGAVARANDAIVTSIAPSPRFAAIAEACGAFGATATEPSDVQAALLRAVAAVQSGRSAVVDVVLAPI